MPLDVPKPTQATHARQAVLSSVDIDAIVAAIGGEGVISGCAVTAQSPATMSLDVAAGTVRIANANVSVTAGAVTIGAADATNPRIDLVSVSSAGAKTVTAGTPAAVPVMPDIPASSVALAQVFVPAAATSIPASGIVDKRAVIVPPAVTVLNRNLATVDVVNTALETSIYSFTIPAGELGTTGGVLLILSGTYLNNTAAASSITIRVKLGATTVMTSNAWSTGTATLRHKWSWMFWFMNNGSTISQKWGALLATPVTGVTNALAIGADNDRIGTADAISAEETALDRVFDITIQHATANSLISLKKEIAILQKLPAA